MPNTTTVKKVAGFLSFRRDSREDFRLKRLIKMGGFFSVGRDKTTLYMWYSFRLFLESFPSRNAVFLLKNAPV
jgi:hypothetical protein